MKSLIRSYERIAGNSLYAAVLIAIVCIVTFRVTIGNDYNIDDTLVTRAHKLTSRGTEALPTIYRSPYYEDDMGYSFGFRPTTLASFAIEKQLFGESAQISHSVNLLLYLATCVLTFLLIVRIFPNQRNMALFAALLFTVHPLHTEVVASIKNRDEILSLLFAMLGCYVLIRPKRWLLALPFAGILLFLSVTSKMSAVNFILLLALIPAYPKPFFKDLLLLAVYGVSLSFVFQGRNVVNGNELRNILVIVALFLFARLWQDQRLIILLKEKALKLRQRLPAGHTIKNKPLYLFIALVPFALTLLTIGFVQTSFKQTTVDLVKEYGTKTEMERWSAEGIHSWKRPFDFVEHPLSPFAPKGMKYGTAAITMNRYLGKLFVPYPLAYYYGYDEVIVDNLFSARSLFSILIHLGLFIIALGTRVSRPAISIGIIIYLTSMVLFSGLVEIVAGMYADRFSYVASFGFCLAFAATTQLTLQKVSAKWGQGIMGAMVLVLLIFAAHTIHRNSLWKNEVTLMRHDIANVPNSAQAHRMLGFALMSDAFADGNAASNKQPQIQEAITHFTRSIQIDPRFFNAWVDLGRSYSSINDLDNAIKAYDRAIEINPSYTPLYLDLAELSAALARDENAVHYYRQYIAANPTADLQTYDALAHLLFMLKRYDESILVCKQALEKDPLQDYFREKIILLEGLKLSEQANVLQK